MTRSLDDDVIAGYIRRTLPVEWMIWWGEAPAGVAKSSLARVLFDSRGRSVDLTRPVVRKRIIGVMLKHGTLRARVEKEAVEFIEAGASALMKQVSKWARNKRRSRL